MDTVEVEIELACGDVLSRHMLVKHRRMYLKPGRSLDCSHGNSEVIVEVREVGGLPVEDLIVEKLSG